MGQKFFVLARTLIGVKLLTNNSVARLYCILTRIMLFSYGYARQIISNRKKCSCFDGHFDGHADQVVRCQAHGPVRQV